MNQRLRPKELRATARRAGVAVLLALGGALVLTALSWLFSGSAASAESGEEAHPLGGVVDTLTGTVREGVHHGPLRTVEHAAGLDRVDRIDRFERVERLGGTLRHNLEKAVEPAVATLPASGKATASPEGDGESAAKVASPPPRPVATAAPVPPPPPPVPPPPEAAPGPVAPAPDEPAPQAWHARSPAGPAVPESSPAVPRQVPAAPAGVSAAGHGLDLGALANQWASPLSGAGLTGTPRTASAAVAQPVLTQPGVTPD